MSPSAEPRRLGRAVRSVLLFWCLALASGCQQSGGGGEGRAPGAGTGVSQDFTGPGPGQAGGLSDLAALGRAFVTSFDAFETAARQLRTQDPRYRLQRNRWHFAGSSTSHDSYPLASARVEYAHAVGLTGAGQVVSVIDSGFRTSHEVFAGRELSFPVGLPVDDHGTAVAAIVAGNSPTMIGVAPGAGLALGGFQSSASRTAAVEAAIRLGAVAQINSWGFELDVSPSSFDAVFSGGQDYLAALEAYARQGVVVFAVSNRQERTQSSLMEALPAIRPSLEPGWLAVANSVPSFDGARVTAARLISAGCLDAARWCLTADGGWVTARAAGDAAYGFGTGSSFAAPQVAGALALLAEAFPDLTPHQLRLRLLASADNGFFAHDGAAELAPGFFHGYSRQFGHGFLDLRAALLPIGTPVVPAIGGGGTVAGAPLVLAGAATGDAVARALASREVLVVDGLGADFRMGAGALVATPVPRPLVRQRLAILARAPGAPPLAAARTGTDLIDRLPVTRIALGQPEDQVALAVLLPEVGRAEAYGIGVQGEFEAPRGALRLGAHVLRDATGSTRLTGLGRGSAGSDAGYSAVLDLEARASLPAAAALTAFVQVGLSDAEDGGALASATATRFSGFGLDLSLAGAITGGDRVSFGVVMPTAVTAGQSRLMLPVARDAGGVVFAPVPVDLSPSDRELRLSVSYAAPLAGDWTIVAEGVHAVNHGHVRGATDTGAVLGLRIAF
jgi:subtilase-type serine protease